MEKETTKDKQTQYEAGSTLLDEGKKFRIPFWFGSHLTLTIKPLKPGTIIKISQQSVRLKDVDAEDEHMIWELMKTGDNLLIFCRIIALAILNSPWRIRLFSRILTRILIWRVPSTKDLFAYSNLVYLQMGAEHFFFTMTLAKGMNFLRKKNGQGNREEAKVSSGH